MTRGLLIAGFAVSLLSFSDAGAVTRVEKGSMKGAVEISVAASVNILKSGQLDETIINIPVRAGGFVSDYFELEGEFMLTDGDNGDAGYIISGLGSLNIPIENSPAMPFFLVGYGVSNTISQVGLITAGDFGLDAMVLSLGGGSKFFLGEHAAFRFEFRYQDFNFDGGEISSYLFFLGCSIFP